MTWTKSQLLLNVTSAQCDQTSLEVVYTVANPGEREVFLVNRLVRVDSLGRPTVDANLVWTRVVDTVLLLVKQLPEIPDWASPEALRAPYLTRLTAHAELTEKIVLPLPVPERYPYMHPSLEDMAPREVLIQRLAVVLGVFTPARPAWVREVTLDGGVELAADWGHIMQAHEVVSSHPKSARCPCLTYSLPGQS
jgi:hypothetical protein